MDVLLLFPTTNLFAGVAILYHCSIKYKAIIKELNFLFFLSSVYEYWLTFVYNYDE